MDFNSENHSEISSYNEHDILKMKVTKITEKGFEGHIGTEEKTLIPHKEFAGYNNECEGNRVIVFYDSLNENLYDDLEVDINLNSEND